MAVILTDAVSSTVMASSRSLMNADVVTVPGRTPFDRRSSGVTSASWLPRRVEISETRSPPARAAAPAARVPAEASGAHSVLEQVAC